MSKPVIIRYPVIRREPNITYCSTFGCGKVLKPFEQLAGNKCTSCMKPKDKVFKHYKI